MEEQPRALWANYKKTFISKLRIPDFNGRVAAWLFRRTTNISPKPLIITCRQCGEPTQLAFTLQRAFNWIAKTTVWGSRVVCVSAVQTRSRISTLPSGHFLSLTPRILAGSFISHLSADFRLPNSRHQYKLLWELDILPGDIPVWPARLPDMYFKMYQRFQIPNLSEELLKTRRDVLP